MSNREIKKLTFSLAKSCKGFNLTALDFYIVNRDLMAFLYQDDLWLMKWTTPTAQFLLAEVQVKILRHPLFEKNRIKKHVHPYWKAGMLREWFQYTVKWMRDNREFRHQDSNGNDLGKAPYAAVGPYHYVRSPALDLGPNCNTTEIQRK